MLRKISIVKTKINKHCYAVEIIYVLFPNIIDFYLNFITSWVKAFDTKYVEGSIIVTDWHYGNPTFGEINHVLVADGTVVIFD